MMDAATMAFLAAFGFVCGIIAAIGFCAILCLVFSYLVEAVRRFAGWLKRG